MRPTRPLLAAALAILLGGTAPAAATTLTFAQEGFAAGGRLAFTIAGTDASGDGVLERMDDNPIDEITGFDQQFAGQYADPGFQPRPGRSAGGQPEPGDARLP